jgi:hypothetical protein
MTVEETVSGCFSLFGTNGQPCTWQCPVCHVWVILPSPEELANYKSCGEPLGLPHGGGYTFFTKQAALDWLQQ